MNRYEVTVSVFADKTLLVAAPDEKEAKRRAIEAIECGDISMEDAEVKHDVIDIVPASDRLYELHDFCGSASDDDDCTADDCDDCECDDCPFAAGCNDETKLIRINKALFDILDVLLEELSADSGADYISV